MSKNFIVLEGKNLDGLIEEGMKTLGVSKSQIDVEVLESKKSLFHSFFKIKISLKDAVDFKKLEQSLDEISQSAINSPTVYYNAIEFIYQEDGVYINLNRSIPIDEIKNKILLKGIQEVNLDLVTEAIKNNTISEPIKIAGVQQEIKVDSKCSIRLDESNMNAFIYVTAPLGGKDITEAAINDALKENNVVFGIREEERSRIVSQKLYEIEIKIAEGLYPVDGEDAILQYHFDTRTDIQLMENEGGKVDFRELSLIRNVKGGQVLATIIKPTDGNPGKNVKGEVLQPKPGKQLQLPKGKNTVISDDGMQLMSCIDGEAKLIDGKVHVFSLYMVGADVDNSTGNIHFIGKVIVKGNVLTGFAIEADGDVEVFGVVEGAKIVSKGNIILHRGIQGMNKGELHCEGDLVAKFIENSMVDVKGNIHSDAIMHSQVVCGKKLEASGRKGLIVGGNFKVADEIKAKVIGSPMATVTELEVGANPEMRKRYDLLKQEQKSISDNLEKVTQAVELLTKMSQKTDLPAEKKEILSKSIKAKLQLMQQLGALNNEVKEMEGYLEELSKGKIKAIDVIYPGTRVTIGSSMMFVKDPLKYLTLYRAHAEIKIGPFEN